MPVHVSAKAVSVSVLMRYSIVIVNFICASISVHQMDTVPFLSMGFFVLRRSGRQWLEISALVGRFINYQLQCSLPFDNSGASRSFRLIFASSCSCSPCRFSGFG